MVITQVFQAVPAHVLAASAGKDKEEQQEVGQFQQRNQEEEGGRESRLLHPRREGVGTREYCKIWRKEQSLS